MDEIIFQLKCIKEHLNFIKIECPDIEFDVEVLDGCILQLELEKNKMVEELGNRGDKKEDNIIILPQTIGDMTFYSKAELFEWIENQQMLNKRNGSFLTETKERPCKNCGVGCCIY